jgi:hypothetical protein
LKARLSKDPNKEAIAETNKTVREIKKDIELNTTSGCLDDLGVIRVYNNSLNLMMLQLVSLYTERTRVNHILNSRHAVMRRYERRSQAIASRFYSDMENFTSKTNGRKLSDFLAHHALDFLARKISDELFSVQESIAKNNANKATHESRKLIVSIEDIEASMDRYISIISGKVKKWIDNDSRRLDVVWDDIEEDISFYVLPGDIEEI